MLARKVQFILKVLLVIIVLIGLGAVLVHTGLAARALLYIAGARTGLQLSAASTRIGFDGYWRFDRFQATIPGEAEPFFTSRQIELHLNPLHRMLASLDPSLTNITLTSPVLTIRRDERDRINIMQWLQKDEPLEPQPARSTPGNFPDISIINATVKYLPYGQKPLIYSGLKFEGSQDDQGLFTMQLSLPRENLLSAVIDLRTLNHKISLQVRDSGGLLSPLMTSPLYHLHADARWDGRVESQEPFRLTGELSLTRFQVDDVTLSAQASVVADSQNIAVEFADMTINPWPLLQELPFRPEPLALTGRAIYSVPANTVTLDDFRMSLFQGTVGLNAQIRVDSFVDSAIIADYTGIRIDPFVPAFLTQPTVLDGRLTIGPSLDPRPLEPMAMTVETVLKSPLMEAAGLGTMSSRLFLGANRIVTDYANIPVFNGAMSPWLSLTRRDGEIFIHVINELRDIDINRIMSALTDEQDNVPGIINGTTRTRMIGSTRALSGSADIRITESDLINTQIIGAVYGALNMPFTDIDLAGRGRMRIEMTGPLVQVTSFQYFNRGVEVRGAGSIRDVTRGADAPVEGLVTGSLRPLRDLGLPGTGSLDRLISGVQVGFASVRVDGTVSNLSTQVVPLPEVQDALRRLLGQQQQEF